MNPNKARYFLHLFNFHLDNQSTGNPKEFATKLGVSRATLYRYIAELRDEGIDIRFSRIKNTFYTTPTTIKELTKLAIIQSSEEQEQNQIDYLSSKTCYTA